MRDGKEDYNIKVLDLINMDKSLCYNPFVYLRNDNDVQRLVTNLFKSTTPKGSHSNDPFWDTAASMLLLALIYYLVYSFFCLCFFRDCFKFLKFYDYVNI